MAEQVRPVREPVTADSVPKSVATDPAVGTDTVVVGCKLPNGLVIFAQDKIKQRVPMPGGYRDEDVWVRAGTPFTLRGNAVNLDLSRRGAPDFRPLINGYAVTEGVPRDLWENYKRLAGGQLIAEKILVEAESVAVLREKTAELIAVRSGLEPLDPENLHLHIGRGRTRAVSAPHTADVVPG